MATELDRLFLTIDADTARLESGLRRAGQEIERFGRDGARSAEQGARGLERALGGVNDNARLTSGQMQNLSFQLNDIATSLASGSSPFQVLAQQGGQVYQALSMGPGGVAGGLRGVRTALLDLATPGRVAAGSIGLLTGAALLAFNSYDQAQSRIKLGLTGIGQASGATVKDIERIGDEIARTQRVSVQAGRDIATAIAATGQVDVSNIAGVGGLTRGFAKVFGVDTEEAGQRLAKIFADPVAGAAELDKRLGNLDARTRAYIQTLAEQGNRQEAIRVLIASAQPILDQAATATSVWARAWDAVAGAAGRAGDAVTRTVGRIADGPTLQERAAQTEARRRQLEGSAQPVDQAQAAALRAAGLTEQQIRDIVSPTAPGAARSSARELEEVTAEAERLNEELRRTAQAKAEAFDAAQARELSKAIDDTFRSLNPEGVGLERVQNQIVQLDNALKNSRARGLLPEGEAEKADASLQALRGRVDLLKQDFEAGGAAAAAALRAANFQAQQAGAASYARGLAEINRQFDEQISLARRAGDAAKTLQRVGTLEAARQATIQAYTTQNRENLVRSTPIAADEIAATIVAESGGSNTARNPRSSALGAGQFIASTFVALFRKYDSERAAAIDAANPVKAEADKVIAAFRTDRQITEKYIEIYLKEIGAALTSAGLESTPANRQLGYFLGPGDAIKLLRSDRSANAASILPSAARSNPEVFRGGNASVQDVLNYAAGRAAGGSAQARASRDRVIALQAEAQAVGQSAIEQERLRTIQDLLNESRDRGDEIGQRYKTAQDLIKASSSDLTPELAAQRAELLKLADARAAASSNLLSARFQQDQQQARDALGRTNDEQSAYLRAQGYATPGTPEFDKTYQGIRDIQALTEAKSSTGTFLKDLNADLMRGANLTDALRSAFSRLFARLADSAIDKVVSGLFKGLTEGATGGGLFGSIGKLFAGGFAEGGTIPAGKFAVVGERGPELLGPRPYPRVVTPDLTFARPSTAVASRPAGNASVTFGDTILQITQPGASVGQIQALLAANNAENRRTLGQQMADWRDNN